MGRLIELQELAEIVAVLKAQKKRVVFTNGAYDLLHVGHVRALRDARSRGDILIVGLNSDASVKKYKNPKLPIIPEQERAEVLTALSVVDYVVLFDEPTADSLLKALHPDVHAKGTDYTPETVPERKTVSAYGGEVVIVGDRKAHGTSKIIQKIRRFKSL